MSIKKFFLKGIIFAIGIVVILFVDRKMSESIPNQSDRRIILGNYLLLGSFAVIAIMLIGALIYKIFKNNSK